VCDVAYAVLVEQFEGDGRAALAAGNERTPQELREKVDELLNADPAESSGRAVTAEERELRAALGVA
jgi:hypothetical protein